uniref:Uncharacterized protein n=1 Tax=Romanomermis culicivorax TaxID=13658 RepID=A0A915IG44_ROMCU
MWALDVSKLRLKFPAPLRFFNNLATSFLQSDVLAYAALDAYYPLLLFLAFGPYGFVPEVYNAPMLFPHDSLDATKIDHLAETLIAAFHNVALTDVLCADSADKIYSTILQIALPAIMEDEHILRPQSVILFRNGAQQFSKHQNINVHDTSQASHPPPESAQRQKDEWNKSLDVSDEEDPALQPRSMFNDPKRLQAVVTSAMKSSECLGE